MYFFYSDPHFGSNNIIRYARRPQLQRGDLDINGKWISEEIALKRGEEMAEKLINNYNAMITDKDTVIYLGDVIHKTRDSKNFRYYVNRLNGEKVYIAGNHDYNNGNKTPIFSCVVCMGNRQIFCVHRPEDMNYNYKFNFVGHSHKNIPRFRKVRKGFKSTIAVNLCVEHWEYRPISFDRIMREYDRWLKVQKEKRLLSKIVKYCKNLYSKIKE